MSLFGIKKDNLYLQGAKRKGIIYYTFERNLKQVLSRCKVFTQDIWKYLQKIILKTQELLSMWTDSPRNDKDFLSNIWNWSQLLRTFLLVNSQNRDLATPTIKGNRVSEISLKLFWWKVHETSKSVHKTSFSNPSLLIGLVGVNLLTTVFARKYIKCPELCRKVTFAQFHPHEDGSIYKIFVC